MKPRTIGALALAVIGILVAAEAVARKSTPAPRSERRFDHEAHEKAAGKLKCSGECHAVDSAGKFQQNGRKEHSRCSKCHTFFRRCSPGNRKHGQVCLACHQNFKANCFSGPKPDFETLDTTYVATYSHAQHIQPGASTGRQCEGCHGKFGDSPPIRQGALAGGHGFCSGCHERGVEPLMGDCDKCHVDRNSPAGKVPVARPRTPSPYATTGAFDHTRHAREQRVGTRGRECLTCHSNIAKAKDEKEIPLPTMVGCYKDCHDGRRAFDATGATCTRCHQNQGGQP
jgi:hypothetical protein